MIVAQLALVALVALATPATGRHAAERHMLEGNEALLEGRTDDAIRAYDAAYALFPSVMLLYVLAQAHEKAGRDVEALTLFERFLAGTADAPDEEGGLREKIQNARSYVANLRLRVATLQIEASPEDARVTLDGAPLVLPGGRGVLRAQPGGHDVAASRPGFRSERRRVTLVAGTTEALALRLAPEPPPASPTLQARPEPPAAPRRRATWWILGAGVVAAVAVASLLLASRRGDDCPTDNGLGCL